MTSSEPESYYRVALPNGLNVDVMTQEGADAFLQHNWSQKGFIGVNMQRVRQLRQLLANDINLSMAQRKEIGGRLVAVYTLFGFVADRASNDVFDAQVNKAELKGFLEHAIDVLTKISNSKIWERTGILQYDYDGELLDTLVTFCKHKKFIKIHEEMGMMKFLAEMCAKREQPRLVCPEFADYILRITNNTNISHEIYLNLTAEKSYQKIEVSGLLLQVLRVISLPRADFHAHCIILDKLQGCPKLLRKTLCKGKPARDVVDEVLMGKNGFPKTVPELVRTRLIDICRIADLASAPLQQKGMDVRFCRNCSKSAVDVGMDTKLLACSKCKNTYYCSRECQVADWKEHRKSCNVGTKVSKTSQQTLGSYTQTFYYEIMTALFQKMQERGVPKTKLILDLDFRNKIGSDESSSPALKGDFKVAVTEDYLHGRDAPDWFREECDESSQKNLLAAIEDHYKRELRSHILVICRHAAAGGAGIFRLQLHSQLTMKPLFADELVTAFGNRDWSTMEQYLDPNMLSLIRQRSRREDMSEREREELDDGMMDLMRRIQDFRASPRWDELQREAEAEGWDRDF